MQWGIWAFIGILLVNSWYSEWLISHADEKPGTESPPSVMQRAITSLSGMVRYFTGPFWSFATKVDEKALRGGHSTLLPPQAPDPYGRPVRTVVVNFEKTLVNSEWTRDSGWIVSKRPHVTAFLERLSRCGYEVVLFTDMNQFDCEQSITDLDQTGLIRHRLYKDSTNFIPFHFVKDLNRLGRDLRNVVMIDHLCETSGVLTPDNCIPVSAWTNELDDKELLALAGLLEKCQKYNVGDMREVAKRYKSNPTGNPFTEEEKRAAEQERLLREEEGPRKEPRKPPVADSNKGSGGLGASISGLFGRK
jgi:hypothetical protein